MRPPADSRTLAPIASRLVVPSGHCNGAHQPQRDPVTAARRVVAEQRRRLVHVDDEHVDVAVVVVVAERGAAARFLDRQAAADSPATSRKRRPSRFRNSCLRCRYCVPSPCRADLGIDVAVGDEDIEQAVVVDVDEADAPAQIRPSGGSATPAA